MSSVKKACICSVCIALCCVLPVAFHALALAQTFSPMHMPVLLCGLICGWPYGAFCGVAGPVIASLTYGMPSMAQLIYMVPELCVYGLTAGLLSALVRTGRPYPDLYLALVPAMLLGRVAGGVARGLFYLSAGREWSLALWAGAYLFGTLPGMVLNLLALPALVLILARARLIPARYPEEGGLA